MPKLSFKTNNNTVSFWDGGAITCLDPQVLHDPFYEQHYLPAAPVQSGDKGCGVAKVWPMGENIFKSINRILE